MDGIPRGLSWLALALSFAVAGCEPASEGAEAAAAAEGAETVSRADIPEWSLASTPSVRIGEADGPPENELFGVSGAAVLADARIVVANAGTQELRFFDADGELVRAVGRSGEGPGEFRFIRSMTRIAGDSLLVWDPGLGRLSFFSPQGEFVRVATVREIPQVRFGGESLTASAHYVHPFDDGEFLVEPGYPTYVLGRGPDGVRQDSVVLFLHDGEGELVGEIGPLPGGETSVQDGNSMPTPYGHWFHLAVQDDRLYAGTGIPAEVRVLTRSGQEVDRLRLPLEPASVTEEEWSGMRERFLEATGEPSRPGGSNLFDVASKPDRRPAYGDLQAGRGGNLWVEKYGPGAEQSEWLVLSTAGEPVGRITIPGDAKLLEAGPEQLLLLRRDELGVEQILLYDVVKPPARR